MTNQTDITPAESVCPIYRETVDPTQQALDAAKLVAEADAQTAKDAARQAVLDKLGLTADEAVALFG